MSKDYLDPAQNPWIPKTEVSDDGDTLPTDPEGTGMPEIVFKKVDDDIEQTARRALEKTPEICTDLGWYLILKEGRPVVTDQLEKTIDLRDADPETLAKVRRALTVQP